MLAFLFCGITLFCSVQAQSFKVLIFSKTAGFRHNSIEPGISAIKALGIAHDFTVDATEDATAFTLENLVQYQAIIFLSTTGNILNSSQQAAFEAYINQGGGYVGIHAASDTEYSWPWYGQLVGAYFDSHPAIQNATIEVPDRVHPSTSFLGAYWLRRDEWYNFRSNPRGNVHVLATLDEATYSGGNMGFDHPIAWCHEFDGGRAWYTGGGHTNASFSESEFMQHILGGIHYVTGFVQGNFEATQSDKFDVTVLDDNPSNPMQLAVLPDFSVLYIERGGKIKRIDSNNGLVEEVGSLGVDDGREDGLLGIVLDPDFENNQWIYLFYSPPGESLQRVSRFEFRDNQLDLASEQVILTIPVQRQTCCHSGGDLEFDQAGNLYISTGDNVNPFQSSGFAPIDERSGRAAFDAQGTSANTNDLRGKILRIRPQPDGTYTIPDGNLFSDPSNGRPEIFTMGSRNPFRIALDKNTGELFWGDVGPDAQNTVNNRGPKGFDEFNRTKVAGNFGWPYCVANNIPYNDYNFSTNTSGAVFDCDHLINDSPNNTGATNLPPAQPAWLYYPYGFFNERPEFESEGGRSALAGDFYKFDSENVANMGFPEYYDNTLFLMEWSRNWIKEVKFDDNGQLLQINSFLPDLKLNRPIDLQFGPDGVMYVVEWGTGFSGQNPDARILKIAYQAKAGNRPPLARILVDQDNGAVPLTVAFTGSNSSDPDIGDQLTYAWDFDGDGVVDSNEPDASFTYEAVGVFNAQLTVMDQDSATTASQVQIVAGNSSPLITILDPVNGGFYTELDSIPYVIDVLDLEDGEVCRTNEFINVEFEPSIGHNDHSHGTGTRAGCIGAFLAEEHGDPADEVFYVVNAAYTDRGGSTVIPLEGSAVHILQPKIKQAEHATELFNLRPENTGDFLGGNQNIGFVGNGSYLKFGPMNFKNIEFITLRFAALSLSSRIEVRIDAPNGPVIASRNLSPTGAWQTYDYFTMPVTDPGGSHDVYFVFVHPGVDNGIGNTNWIEFHGRGVAQKDPQAQMGLTASYFNSPDFSGEPIKRKDPMVAWDWDASNPIEGVGVDNFSVRWEGQVIPPSNGTYEFRTESSNGNTRVWVNDQLIVNNGFDRGSIRLNGGVAYNLKMEYTHTSGKSKAYLRWAGPNPVNVIHTNFLRALPDLATSVNNQVSPPPLKVFPNPANDQLNVNQPFWNKWYTISSVSGKVLEQHKVLGPIDVSSLPPGMYLIAIQGELSKFVKQ